MTGTILRKFTFLTIFPRTGHGVCENGYRVKKFETNLMTIEEKWVTIN